MIGGIIFVVQSAIDEEIAAMPDGKETLVGTGGVRLSEGQAQSVLRLREPYIIKRPVMILG